MGKRKTIAFNTLGCKLNFSETDAISRQSDAGVYTIVPFKEHADIYVINSCTVTKNAEKRCKALIRQAMNNNPAAHVAVIGCYSQINPKELLEVPGVSLVLGNSEKFNLFDHLKKIDQGKSETDIRQSAEEKLDTFMPSFSTGGRTRSFFKIQDGCDYKCAYCTIPLARGKSRSNTIAETIRTAQKIAGTNMKEVVLTGVNIGDFGKPHGESFVNLLRELVRIDGIDRIRLSSVEPDLLHDEIIQLVKDEPKLMPHFHIPLQSGSDKTLKAMGRRYTTEVFRERVNKIRQLIPHACIAADLIVGYPDETEACFEESYQFIKKQDISYIHVFTYSERENTRALHSGQEVHPAERKRRSKQMQTLSADKKKHFLLSNRGLETKVLWERDAQSGFMFGFTENYIKVKTRFDAARVNTIERVMLNKLDNHNVYQV